MTRTVDIMELQAKAHWVRRKVLQMAVKANSGHVSTAMSQTEILVALYHGGILKHDPKNPQWEGRDYFLLSKGQGGIGLYPILADRGYFPVEDLDNFTGVGSKLGVHAEWSIPGVEMLSGSLGHGLPVATGICQTLKNDKKDNLVFCLTGDGELQEGSNWEALMFAGWHKLNNLVLIIDRNGQNTIGQTDGDTVRDGPGLDNLFFKLHSFGFTAVDVDGHNLDDLLGILTHVRRGPSVPGTGPYAIIANTKKGKGLSCMEDKRNWHYRVPYGRDLEQCWKDLGSSAEVRCADAPNSTKHAVGMRDRFFNGLYEHFKRDKSMVLITADDGAPTMDQFCSLPGQFYQVGIAEQQMIGMASGMAKMGRKVFCYSIAPFITTRVHEFIKLDVAGTNANICLIGVGAGLCYDIMCITHHTTEDISIMRALPNMKIYSPSDGTTAAALVDEIVEQNGPSYIRLDRGGVNDIYDDPNLSEYRTDDWIRVARPSNSPCSIAIISTGIMTHRAMEVGEELDAHVIDIVRLKPINAKFLFRQLNGCTGIVTLEEHQLNGGLGSVIAEIIVDSDSCMPLLRLGIDDRFLFEMGGRDELHRICGLDKDSVVNRIKQWQNKLVGFCGTGCCDLER